MSTSNRIKDTINALITKYQANPFTNAVLVPALKLPEFETVLEKLMNEYSEGKKFTPMFLNLFKSFDLFIASQEPTIKAIVLNAYPHGMHELNDGMAFSFGNDTPVKDMTVQSIEFGTARLNSEKPDKMSYNLEHLPRQGVLMLNAAMTCPIGAIADHFDLWAPITTEIIRCLCSHNQQPIAWVFIGSETENYGKVLPKEQLRFYVPTIQRGWDYVDVFNNVNKALKLKSISPIRW